MALGFISLPYLPLTRFALVGLSGITCTTIDARLAYRTATARLAYETKDARLAWRTVTAQIGEE